MTEIVTEYNSFWLIVFIFLTIVAVIIGIVIRGKSSDKKDTTIFAKSSDNAKEVTIDTTSKMAQMHNNVVKVDFTEKHESEFHSLERGLKDLDDRVKDLKKEVDKLIARVIELENNR